jgi:hypothetical protein
MKWLALLVLMLSSGCQMSGEARPANEAGAYYDSGELGDLRGLSVPPEAAPAREQLQAPIPVPNPKPEDPATQRQVIYSAVLRLVVVSARETHAAITNLAKQAGGYLQESDARSITIRVPADAFEGVVAKVAGLGEVLDSNIRAADVTEEMLDLGIRLDNAKKARERLLEHLANSVKIEDTLKIEAELTRVTGEIEQIEGRLRFMHSQISMSTIRVELNTNEPQRAGTGLDLPFDWVERLGDGLVAGTVKSMPKKPQFFSRGPSFDPPAEFVRYYTSKNMVEAMNAAGVRIKLQVQDNFDEGALGFWSTLARKALVQSRSLAVTESRDLSEGRALIRGTRAVGSQTFGYLLVITRTKSNVYTFEAWGPDDAFSPLVPKLVESAKSLDT